MAGNRNAPNIDSQVIAHASGHAVHASGHAVIQSATRLTAPKYKHKAAELLRSIGKANQPPKIITGL
jgi:hypothetical protein